MSSPEAFAKSSILFMPSSSSCDAIFSLIPPIVSSSFLTEGRFSVGAEAKELGLSVDLVLQWVM